MEFKVGDRVVFTNDAGNQFMPYTIGLIDVNKERNTLAKYGAYYYFQESDSPSWFPHKASTMRLMTTEEEAMCVDGSRFVRVCENSNWIDRSVL